MTPKPARPEVSELEQKILAAAGKARAKPIRGATVAIAEDGSACLLVVDLHPDGRWFEVRRGEPTGRHWAETQLLDETHAQKLARMSA